MIKVKQDERTVGGGSLNDFFGSEVKGENHEKNKRMGTRDILVWETCSNLNKNQ